MLTKALAAEAVLTTFFTRLNVAAMTALATNGVHNRVAPQGTVPPYLLIALFDEGTYDTMATPGADVLVMVKAVSHKRSDLEGHRIVSKAVELLGGSALVIAGWTTIGLSFRGMQTPYDDLTDGVLFRHFPALFEVTVQYAG